MVNHLFVRSDGVIYCTACSYEKPAGNNSPVTVECTRSIAPEPVTALPAPLPVSSRITVGNTSVVSSIGGETGIVGILHCFFYIYLS